MSDAFLKPFNLENLMKRPALFGIISIGVAFVIITGGIDLSIGSIICLVGCGLPFLLQVEYVAIGEISVARVVAESGAVQLARPPTELSAGDRVRLWPEQGLPVRSAVQQQLLLLRVRRRARMVSYARTSDFSPILGAFIIICKR